MDILKRDNETDLEYHKRIVYGKLVDKTYADADYAELAELIYGQQYSSDVARRMMYGSKRTLDILSSEEISHVSDVKIMSEIDQKMLNLQIERQKFFDQRAAFNKVVRDRSRQEELNEILIQAVSSGDLPKLEYVPSASYTSDNDLLVSLNDIHYGANVKNYWNTYNSDICREMMCKYLDNILSIKSTHGSESCIVWANGDMINGNIHHSIAVSNKENVVEQVKGVSELIAEFLVVLSRNFSTVSYVSVSGNHSRIDPNKDKSLVGERLDDLIEWYLSARLNDFDNIFICDEKSDRSPVKYNKVDNTMYIVNVRGKTYCGVHGDFDGSPGKVQSLQTMVGSPVYAVLSGHLHHCKTDDVQGIRTIMAGSFLGMDEYCVQKRIYGTQEQMVCVCDEYGIRCSYNVQLK